MLFLVSLFTWFTTSAKADIASSVMLHHNGHVTLYQWDKVQDAVDAAAEGDTIYLSEGTFAPFDINKRILVRGAGFATMIQGDIHIGIPGTDKLTMPVLDAMKIGGTVSVNSAAYQFTLRKCNMDNLQFANNGVEFSDVKLDRCWVTGTFELPKTVKELNAFNSAFQTMHPQEHTSGNLTFDHCSFRLINEVISGTFTNCAINGASTHYGYNDGKATLVHCVLKCCVYNGYSLYVKTENCTASNWIAWGGSSSYEFSLTFQSSNYMSEIDGTYIGIYGGQHPYTMTPELPRVTKHTVSVDAANQMLNVTLTIDKE